MTKKSQK